MRYSGFSGYRRTIGTLAFRRNILCRTIKEGIEGLPARKASRTIPIVPDCSPCALAHRDVPLIVVTRNGEGYVPSFLRHYRGLGVTRFIVLDDQSSDSTCALLRQEPDVDLWTSPLRYAAAGRGLGWRNQLARHYGYGRWYLNVDIDEYLAYDGMDRHPLPDLLRLLRAKGHKRMLGPMLDFYPENIASAARLGPDGTPWTAAPFFDRDGYRIEAGDHAPKIHGGLRPRAFGVNSQLVKFPLLYWDRATFLHRSTHIPFPYHRNFMPIFGVLLHFKIFSDFQERVAEAVRDGQYWMQATTYKKYQAQLAASPDMHLKSGISERFSGTDRLVDLGLMERIDWDSE